MKFAQHPVWIKKEIIPFTTIAPAEFHPPVVKNMFLTLFQGRFSYEDQHPWMSSVWIRADDVYIVGEIYTL